MCAFDPAEIVPMNINEDTAKKIKKLPFCGTLEESEVLRGYKELQTLIKKQMHDRTKTDIVRVLQGMTFVFPKFSESVLKTILIPCSNANCELVFQLTLAR